MSDNFNISFGEETIFGADGKSAYQIACEHGFVGTVDEWLTSLKGNTPDITAYATIDGTIGNPGVEVEEAGTIDNPELTFKFSGLKGEKGDTGATPVITADGSVNQTVGTPSVEISKTGTAENPHFNFAFRGIKGQQGIKGDTGATPNITANATIDATVGTPSVDVSKSGTNENPVLSFAFHNLKGEKGDDGLDGFASRLTKKITPVATDYIPINEADGTAKCINYATMDRLLNSWDDVNLFKGTVSNSNYAGISLIPNDNGEYTINGTPTGDVYFNPIGGTIELQNGLYYAKAESEASTSTHRVMIQKENKTTGATSYVANIVSNQYLTISDADEFAYYCYIVVKKDLVCNDLKIMPNLVLIEAADGNKNNKRIVKEIDTNMGIVGNLIPEQEVQTIENNGITFSVESDGSFTMNGTATAQITQYFDVGVYVQKGDIIVISGAENFKDNFSVQSNDQVFFTNLNATTGNVNTWRSCTAGLGSRTFEITATSLIRVGVRIQADHTYDNFKVYPSIHIIGKKEVDTAYTNKELGDRIEELENYLDATYKDNIDVNGLEGKGIGFTAYSVGAGTPHAPTNQVARIITTQNFNAAAKVQFAIDMDGNAFIRRLRNSTWSEWKRLIVDGDLYLKNSTLGNTTTFVENTESVIELNSPLPANGKITAYLRKDGNLITSESTPMFWFNYSSASSNKVYLFNAIGNNERIDVYKIDDTHVGVKPNATLASGYALYIVAESV